MDLIDNLRNLAVIADSRATTYPVGDETRTDLQWFASKAESLANAIGRGVVQGDRIGREIASLNEITDAMPTVTV